MNKLKWEEQMTGVNKRHRSSIYDPAWLNHQTVPCFDATGMTDRTFGLPIVGEFRLGRKIRHVTSCMILGSG